MTFYATVAQSPPPLLQSRTVKRYRQPRAAVESAVAVQADVEFDRSALNAEKVYNAMQYKLYISNKKCPGRIMKYNSLSFLEIMTDCPTDLPTKHLRRWSLPIFIKGHGISYK